MLAILLLIFLPAIGICFVYAFEMPERMLPWIGIVMLINGFPFFPVPFGFVPTDYLPAYELVHSFIALSLAGYSAFIGVKCFRKCNS